MSMPTASIAPQPSSPKKPEEWPYAFAHSGNRIRVAQLETSTVAAATAVTAVVVEKVVLRLARMSETTAVTPEGHSAVPSENGTTGREIPGQQRADAGSEGADLEGAIQPSVILVCNAR